MAYGTEKGVGGAQYFMLNIAGISFINVSHYLISECYFSCYYYVAKCVS